VRAVLLDALGTLVYLEPPGPRLRNALREIAGVEVSLDQAERAFRAEIGHYLAHHTEGGDGPGLDRLRDDCAEVMRSALPDPRPEQAAVREAMLAALSFAAFPDVVPTLRDLRARGTRLVVVSNWDCSLPEWLEGAGLASLLDGTVSSAAAGEPKPGPAPFTAALALAGVAAHEALHVGDSLEADVEGAQEAGIRAVLLARDGDPPEGVEAVSSLAELASLL
jgi:putative hydrolase of the HAD superfamily